MLDSVLHRGSGCSALHKCKENLRLSSLNPVSRKYVGLGTAALHRHLQQVLEAAASCPWSSLMTSQRSGLNRHHE